MKRIATIVALGAVAYYQTLHAPVNAESGLFREFVRCDGADVVAMMTNNA